MKLIPVPCPELPCPVIWLITISAITMSPAFLHLCTMLMNWSKLYIPSTLNTDYLLWHTHLIVCVVTLSGINVGQGINIGPGKVAKKNIGP